jgi:agmatinase
MSAPSNPTGNLIPEARNAGIATFMNLPSSSELDGVGAAVVGIPYDLGGEAGGRHAPRAIRHVSWMLRSTHGAFRIDLQRASPAVDYGDVAVHPTNREATYAAVEDAIGAIAGADAVPVIFAGEHSLLLPVLRAISRRHGPVGLIQVDAHSDTQDRYYGDERYTAGSVIRRAVEEAVIAPERTIQVGTRGPVYSEDDHLHVEELGLARLTMDDVDRLGIAGTAAAIAERCGEGPVYLSFDMDAVDPAFAPGTGRREPGGFTSREALALVRALRPLRIVGFDLNEVNPLFETEGTTCVLAANLAFEFLALTALRVSGR